MPEIKISKVRLDLDDVWEAISDDQFASELHGRASNGPVQDAISYFAPECDPEDRLWAPLDDWARADLLKAIREDDGRRAIDVLKRAAA